MDRLSPQYSAPSAPSTGGVNRLAGQEPQESGGRFAPILNFLKGAAKGVGSTAVGLQELGGKLGGEALYGGIKKVLPGSGRDVGNLFTEEQVSPKGTAEKIGFGAEQIAEFLIPASKTAKASKAIDIAAKGSRVLRVLGKAGLEAGVSGTISLGQTGGDLKEAGKTALLFGGTRAVTSGIGEGLKAFGVPEKLYGRIFKTNYKTMLSEIKAKGIETFAKTHPEQYSEFVKNGIIKKGLGGKSVLNESLAKKALDRGLKGSLRNMSDKVVEDTVRLEDMALKTVKNTNKTINIQGKDRLANILSEVGERYNNVGDGSVSKKAINFAAKLRSGVKLNAEDGLKLRRFLDGMRIHSSFDPGASLSLGQSNFKYWSNIVRSKLSKVPGLQDIMSEYKFNIEAMESLAREASRRGNAQVVGFLDSIFLGGGLAVGEPITAVGLGVGRRIINSPRGLTSLGSAINRSGTPSRLGTAIKATANQIINPPRER